jgi:quinoprotein glucose dehydrogenase
MKLFSLLGLSLACCQFALAPAHGAEAGGSLWAHDNLAAWCVVPFDAKERGPEERAEMFNRLGITMFAYDWRPKNIPTFDAEIEALEKHHVKLLAWWFPSNPNDPAARQILEACKRHNEHPQLWVMWGGAFAHTPDEQKQRIEEMAGAFKAVDDLAKPYGCAVEIYNHNAWGGNEDNELAVLARLKEMGVADVGMVYNFSHALDEDHDDTAGFPALWKRMQPHVVAVNITGMGPKRGIIYPSEGNQELEMMRVIQESGWRGPVGIIGEKGGDAEVTLSNYIKGIDWLAAELKQPGSGGPRPFGTFHEESPAPVTSSSGQSASTGPLVLVDGKFGKAADLSMDGILLPGREEYHGTPITAEAWVKLHDASNYNIIMASDPKASNLHWEMYTISGSGVLSVFLPGRNVALGSGVNICDDTWHYVAMVLEEKRVSLYVDGKLVKQTDLAPLAPVPDNFAIGRLVEGGIGCNGVIEDVRISEGTRALDNVPTGPLTRDDKTIDLWALNQSGPPTGHEGFLHVREPVFMPAPPAAVPAPTPSFSKLPPEALPEYVTIPAAAPSELTPANGWPTPWSYFDWTRSQGGPTSDRYSALEEINKTNVGRLEQAWVYHSKDGAANIQCNPIIVNGTVFLPTAGLNLAAVDGADGHELWRFTPEREGKGLEDVPARRGLLYWPGDAHNPPRIIFTMGTYIYALDPSSGKPLESFGERGRSRLPPGGSSVAGAVYNNVLIFPGFASNCYGYDVRTGAPLWCFNTLPTGDEPGAESWTGPERNGANCWGGMALDESRGIAYFSTGSPKPNFIGYQHTGDDLFGNCLVALDATTGKYLWHFQEIRHDVWDLDIPAPPNLVTVMHDGKKVDAVAQVTKIGNTLLLDRVTGKPLFPFRLRRAPAFKLPGDAGAPYQPDVQMPEPFARQEFALKDVTNISPAAHESVMKNFVSKANLGWFVPFEENKPSVYFGIHGGAEWTGAAVDPQGRLYVSASELPWLEGVNRISGADTVLTPQAAKGRDTFLMTCATCHGPHLEGKGMVPSLRGLEMRLNEQTFRQILAHGRNGMPAWPQLSQENIANLVAFLLPEKSDGAVVKNSGPPRWADMGFTRVLDDNQYPGCTPPWGTLTCIDLNTGHIAWKVPLGEYPELTARGIPKTGTENFGGATVTAGRLVFVSGTRDNKIRAFDADNGNELWSAPLPLHGTAPPAVYEAKGREYVILPATGSGKLGGPAGDAWVAFALPPG